MKRFHRSTPLKSLDILFFYRFSQIFTDFLIVNLMRS